jgi:CRISPR-associated protein Cmr2
MSNYYLGLTIGPIYKTIIKADKTREAWGASYLFSYLMKKIMENLPSKWHDRVLLPSMDLLKDTNKPGVGLYPDRLILSGDSSMYEEMKTVVQKVKKVLSVDMTDCIHQYSSYDPYTYFFKTKVYEKEDQQSLVKQFLEDYLQIYFVEATNDQLGGDQFKSINGILDHLELRPSMAHFDPDPLKAFLRASNHSALREDAFHPSIGHFDSIVEVSTVGLRFIKKSENGRFSFRSAYDRELIRSLRRARVQVKAETFELEAEDTKVLEEEKDEKYITEEKVEDPSSEKQQAKAPEDLGEDDLQSRIFSIPGIKDHLRLYHKYIAIVHADGDHMGKLIGSLNNDPAAIQTFSKDLLSFAQAANKAIAGKKFTHADRKDYGYGGSPLYIGGDDLVFFAPVASFDKDGNFRTIFDLVRRLDELFDEHFNAKTSEGGFEKYPDLEQRPCLSYGLSITYHKYPLQEAIEMSRELMGAVKDDSIRFKQRNHLHFKIRKHSGQPITGIIDKKHPKVFQQFTELLKESTQVQDNENTQFVNSLAYNLERYKAALFDCVLDETRLEAFFEQTFNEPIHKAHEDYLHAARALISVAFQAAKKQWDNDVKLKEELLSEGKEVEFNDSFEDRQKETLQTLYAMFRFIHFINDKNVNQ